LAATFFAGGNSVALAATHFVSAATSSLDGSTLNPGDTIVLAGGNRGPITLANLTGTAANPIVIRNDATASGPTVIRRTAPASGGFVFLCNSCVHVKIDGSAKWVGAPAGITYGIRITTIATGDAPSTFLMMAGLSSNFTIRNVEIDGRWPDLSVDGIGIQLNDHALKASEYPNVWRHGILIERNYVHDVEGEGLYIGPNWVTEGIPLRDVEIAQNRVEDTGWDCIQLKSAIQGKNLVHHNRVLRCGVNGDGAPSQHHGISCYEAMCDIYNNWIERVGEHAIQHYVRYAPSSLGPFPSDIYNNVAIDAGVTGPQDGQGISVGREDAAAALPIPTIRNNTIVRTESAGVSVNPNVLRGAIRDNIVADAGSAPISAPEVVEGVNNRIGSVTSIGFVDAIRMDFHLREDSPARDSGSTSLFPSYDFDGESRPHGSAADQGAFEFVSGEGDLRRPKPPALVQVE
jgi:hypothetical protein